MNKEQLIVALAMAALPFLSNSAFAKESNAGDDKSPYPVRWTSEVKIKDLNELDSHFDKPVDMSKACGGCSLELTDEKDENKKVKIATCGEYFDPKYKDFYAKTTHDLIMLSWFMLECDTLKFLKNSIPSKVSYLSDFILSKNTLRYFPAYLVGFSENEEEIKIMRTKTLKDLRPKLKVKAIDKFNLDMEYNDATHQIEILAWGDFNHDDIEDVLIFITHHSMLGTGRFYESVILTRLEKKGKLIELPLQMGSKDIERK